MDGNGPSHRQHRSSLSASFTATGGLFAPARLPWDLSHRASPTRSSDHNYLRPSHDDRCLTPAKCPTSGHMGHRHAVLPPPSFNTYHTRHYGHSGDFVPVLANGQFGTSRAAAVTIPWIQDDDFIDPALYRTGSPSGSRLPPVYGLPEDLADLSSRRRSRQNSSCCDSECGLGDVCQSSECGLGDVCHGSECADDTSVCDDENCPDKPAPITSEDARAAAALTSFGDVGQQWPPPAFPQQPLPGFDAASQACEPAWNSSASRRSDIVDDPAFDIGLGELWSSPEFLRDFRHLVEAHRPKKPLCPGTEGCPVTDPKFYGECHFRDASPRQNLFDHVDMSTMSDTGTGAECGAKLGSASAMIQHFWNDHLGSLPSTQPAQPPAAGSAAHMRSDHRSSVSSANNATLDRSPASFNTVVTSPLTPPTDFDMGLVGLEGRVPDNAQAVPPNGQEPQRDGQEAPQEYICQWCEGSSSTPCGKTFHTAEYLHKHALRAHLLRLERDDDNDYPCGWKDCPRAKSRGGKGFPQKSKIERHTQTHTGNKPWRCDICDVSFSARQALEQHQLIHKDLKPLQCDVCLRFFRQQSSLAMHKRTHSGEKPLKCNICGALFRESSNLSKHRKTHNLHGDFVCPLSSCGKDFKRKEQLYRHMSKKHPVIETSIARELIRMTNPAVARSATR